MTRFVIFTGPSKSGKSLAARLLTRILQERNPAARISRESFEAPVKYYLSMLLGQQLDSLHPETPISALLSSVPRAFIVREAAHMRFSYGPTVLGKLLLMRTTRKPAAYTIIDDGSSVNDIRELGDYFLIQMERDKVERVYPFTIPGADFVAQNSGTIQQLRAMMVKVANILEIKE